jgi:hypothetical protein
MSDLLGSSRYAAGRPKSAGDQMAVEEHQARRVATRRAEKTALLKDEPTTSRFAFSA